MTTTTVSKSQRLTGQIMSGFVILFILFDAVLKFSKPEPVVQTTVNELGYSEHHILIHGFLGLNTDLALRYSQNIFSRCGAPHCPPWWRYRITPKGRQSVIQSHALSGICCPIDVGWTVASETRTKKLSPPDSEGVKT